MPVYLGLDCGGSTSRVLALDESAEVVFARTAGPANLVSTPPMRLRRNLERASEGAPEPTAVCGCFAGLIDEAMRERALELLRELFPQARLRAEPDYFAAFRAFELGSIDICIIAGTGSLVCSSVDGKLTKTGGRGYILGDPGSAFQYGRDALNAYLDDPKAASPVLTRTILRVFGDVSCTEMIARIYMGGAPSLLAKLSPALAADAGAQRAYALESLAKNGEALANVVCKHTELYHADRRIVSVGLAGGLWNSSVIYQNAVHAALQRAMPNREFQFVSASRPPVHGSVALAKELMNGY